MGFNQKDKEKLRSNNHRISGNILLTITSYVALIRALISVSMSGGLDYSPVMCIPGYNSLLRVNSATG